MSAQKFNHKAVAMQDPFILSGNGALIPVRAITYVDLQRVEELVIIVHHEKDGMPQMTEIEGVQATEALMLLKPSAMEGRRMRWARQAWLLHNTVGHSYLAAMSLAAWGIKGCFPEIARRLVRHGVYIHDKSCPNPIGKTSPKGP